MGALDAFTDGVERRVDLASVNERVFVDNASLGVYARIVQCDEYRDSKLGTWKRMLPEMLGEGRGQGRPPVSDASGEGLEQRLTLVIVSNNPYQLRRLRGVGTRPRMDTGQLGIFATRMHNARSVAKLVTLGTIGQHRRFGGALQWSSVEFEIHSGAAVAVGLDGGGIDARTAAALLVLTGSSSRACRGMRAASHRHTGAVPLTARNVWALARIAAGKPTIVPSQR